MLISSNRNKYITAIIIAIASLLLIILFINLRRVNIPPAKLAVQEVEISDSNLKPVIIFASLRGRIWNKKGIASAVWDIQKIELGSQPIVLATVDDPDMSQYYSDALRQGNKIFLWSNKALRLLDLKTNKLSTIIKAKQYITGAVFSPDRKNLIAFDHSYGEKPIFYKLDVSTSKYITVYPELSKEYKGMLAPAVWRNDDLVLLSGGQGMISSSWYLDLRANKIFPAIASWSGPLGKYSLRGTSWAEDLCNLELRSGPEAYEIVDPVINKKFGQFGEKGKLTTVVRFSPDESKILYYTENTFKPAGALNEGCTEAYNDLSRRQYFTVDTKSGNIQKVSDYKKQLLSWYPEEPLGIEIRRGKNNHPTIYFNEQSLISSGNELKILVSYFSER